MPAAVVTAKGRFIYVVTFPDADSPVEKWDVEEFEICAGKFAKDPSNEKSLLNSFRGSLDEVKRKVYEDFRERAKRSRLGTNPNPNPNPNPT